MPSGIITKALSGFYYISDNTGKLISCRARGKFRVNGLVPLVGDRVEYISAGDGTGTVIDIYPRKNFFIRPAVANIDIMVIVAAAVNPVTDPFLIDRMTSLAEFHKCESIICINKSDMDAGEQFRRIYNNTPYVLLNTSAVTGEGIPQLKEMLSGKTAAFSGNSGVGKSSLLNALEPGLNLKSGEVSDKLGRGKHTTRHVELFSLSNGGYLADTPGFGSFDFEQMESVRANDLQYCFPEFKPHLHCYFNNCAHIREPGCAVLEAVKNGHISQVRHDSYVRLYEQAKKTKDWERKNQ